MKMPLVFCMSVLLPVLLHAQPGNEPTAADGVPKGIRFEKGLSWQQVLEKAKAENKFIFVDCYATWCGPCKQMERDVYPVPQVEELYNDRFISVKMQMDSSKADDEWVKRA